MLKKRRNSDESNAAQSTADGLLMEAGVYTEVVFTGYPHFISMRPDVC
jgi:hypothetical protein